MLGGRRHKSGAASSELFVAYVQLELAAFNINGDLVAVFNKGDWAASCSFGAYMANAGTLRGAGEAAVGQKRTLLDRPMPTMALVGVSISRMPGPPFGPS